MIELYPGSEENSEKLYLIIKAALEEHPEWNKHFYHRPLRLEDLVKKYGRDTAVAS